MDRKIAKKTTVNNSPRGAVRKEMRGTATIAKAAESKTAKPQPSKAQSRPEEARAVIGPVVTIGSVETGAVRSIVGIGIVRIVEAAVASAAAMIAPVIASVSASSSAAFVSVRRRQEQANRQKHRADQE